MSDLRYLFEPVLLLLRHKFSIWGFSISFFEIFLVSILIGFVANALGKLFGGD